MIIVRKEKENNHMKQLWNERYSAKEYVYGKTPNEFFKNYINNETPKTILLPCEGEGRNSVYAAKKGWQVHALDFSEVAREKAMKWADANKVDIHYDVADIVDWDAEIKIDCIALIFAHFSTENREAIHRKLISKLNPGGCFILEAFSKKQLDYDSGGPKTLDRLYDLNILKNDFASLKIEFLQERTVHLQEGSYHEGEASIIRMIAKNPKK
jgi:hypothetical protein